MLLTVYNTYELVILWSCCFVVSLHISTGHWQCLFSCFLCVSADYNPEEVGSEGRGYVWDPDRDSDQDSDVIQDQWGKDSTNVLKSSLP